MGSVLFSGPDVAQQDRCAMADANRLTRFGQLRQLEQDMNKATTYEQWRRLAQQHDEASGKAAWKLRDEDELYDARHIKSRYQLLKDLAAKGDNQEILFALNEGIHGNMGGMGKPALYKQAKLGTKQLIDDYVAGIKDALNIVADAPESEIPFDEKLDFFRRASHCFGRSALSLSGGSGLIYFHHGVVHALAEQELLPKVLSGASAGSWICAQLGTRTDQELKDYFVTKRYDFKSALGLGDALGLLAGKNRDITINDRDDVIDDFVGTQTFQEAYEHTGRYINISIAPSERHQTARLMNAITSPNVTIRSAAKASSSVPGLVEPVALEAKNSHGRLKPYLRDRRWVDGSFAEDLPFKRLSRLFGVNHYIVSMINPLAVPFIREDPKTAPDSVLKSANKLFFLAVKESIKTARRWASPVSMSKADAFLGIIYQLMDQEYTGDINIILSAKDIRTRNTLFNYRDDSDITGLIEAGMRATWPKLDMIRNSTSISHVIDGILTGLEDDAVANTHSRHVAHLTL